MRTVTKFVAWLGGPEVEVFGDTWLVPSVSEEEAIVLMSMNGWINLNGGTLIPLEVGE